MSNDRDSIQKRLLSNISDEYDKSQGSFFYDVEKPVAIELEKIYKDQEDILNKGFIETASGIYLDKKASEQGVYRKQATKSTGIVTVTGSVGAIINIGDRVATDIVNFIFLETKVIDETGQVDVNIECEIDGAVGNVGVGMVKYFPITLAGLTSVINKEAITNGYVGETDDELKERYYLKVRTPATSGNKYHYLIWAKEITGVGDARVFPLWNGNGTIKVIIIDNNKIGAKEKLINKVIEHIETQRPIGATVTVISAIEKAININVNLNIDSNNYSLEQAITNISNNITDYLADIAFKEDYVSHARIGSIILSSEGVLDYSDLHINNATSNITIENEEVAVLGGVIVG